ncbi:MAG: HAD hydrolase family protein [Bacteroidaceae bacterium]|nr:HAD hydrolase family protein [Bacteroidaceae bacterium]
MIDYDLTKIKAFVFDVDGVLSTQTIPMGPDGIPQRSVNIKDGYAIQLAVKLGFHVIVITGGNSPAIARRYEGLGVKEVHLSAAVKIEKFREVTERLGIQPEQSLYMGDDIPDYEVMQVCGLPCCPQDAAPEIQAISRYVSPITGGNGCVRDVIEQVLRSQDLWNMDKTAFGW